MTSGRGRSPCDTGSCEFPLDVMKRPNQHPRFSLPYMLAVRSMRPYSDTRNIPPPPRPPHHPSSLTPDELNKHDH